MKSARAASRQTGGSLVLVMLRTFICCRSPSGGGLRRPLIHSVEVTGVAPGLLLVGVAGDHAVEGTEGCHDCPRAGCVEGRLLDFVGLGHCLSPWLMFVTPLHIVMYGGIVKGYLFDFIPFSENGSSGSLSSSGDLVIIHTVCKKIGICQEGRLLYYS